MQKFKILGHDGVTTDIENDMEDLDDDGARISVEAISSYEKYDCTAATPVHKLGTGLHTDVKWT